MNEAFVVFAVSLALFGIVEGEDGGVVMWLPFNNSFSDYSGNSNAIFGYNNPTFSEGRCGESNASLSFDGTKQQYLTFYSNVVSSLSSFSLVVWAKLSGLSPILDSGSYSWMWEVNTFNLMMTYHFSVSEWYEFTCKSAILNTWHHFAITFDVSTGITKFYDNGISLGEYSPTSATHSASTTIYIGCGASGGIEYLTGNLQDLRIYNRVLSVGEITEIVTPCPSFPSPSPSPSPVVSSSPPIVLSSSSSPSFSSSKIIVEKDDEITTNVEIKFGDDVDVDPNELAQEIEAILGVKVIVIETFHNVFEVVIPNSDLADRLISTINQCKTPN